MKEEREQKNKGDVSSVKVKDTGRDEMLKRVQKQTERLERQEAIKQAATSSKQGKNTNEIKDDKKWEFPILASEEDKKEAGTSKRWKLPFLSSSENATAPIIEIPQSLISTAQNAIREGFNSLSSSSGKDDGWVVAAAKTAISPGAVVPVEIAGLSLILVASKDGTILNCFANSCPHLGTPLDTGVLETRKDREIVEIGRGRLMSRECQKECIVCPLHRTAFSLENGDVVGEWCPYPPIIGKVMGTAKVSSPLPSFEVRTRGKNIEVKIISEI